MILSTMGETQGWVRLRFRRLGGLTSRREKPTTQGNVA